MRKTNFCTALIDSVQILALRLNTSTAETSCADAEKSAD